VLPHGRIGAQEMMIDDDEVGGGGALAHARHEALVVARTLGAEARLGSRRYLVPEREIFGQILELGSVAGRGFRRPVADDRQENVVRRRADANTGAIEAMET